MEFVSIMGYNLSQGICFHVFGGGDDCMTRNSLERRRKVFFGRLASLSVIAFVVALALLSAACNNVNLAGEGI